MCMTIQISKKQILLNLLNVNCDKTKAFDLAFILRVYSLGIYTDYKRIVCLNLCAGYCRVLQNCLSTYI